MSTSKFVHRSEPHSDSWFLSRKSSRCAQLQMFEVSTRTVECWWTLTCNAVDCDCSRYRLRSGLHLSIGLNRGHNSCRMNCWRSLRRRAIRLSVPKIFRSATTMLPLPFSMGCVPLPCPVSTKGALALASDLPFHLALVNGINRDGFRCLLDK